jgi:PAS domain S-box-containing protein
VARDITKRRVEEDAVKLAKEEAERERSRSDAILASIADGAVITDPFGMIVAINPAMEELAGWSKEEARGQPYAQVYPLFDTRGQEISEEGRFLARAMAGREVVASRGYDVVLVARDGRRVPVSVKGAPIIDERGDLTGGVDVLRDVSHEREVDQLKSALVSTVSHELRTPLTMIQGFSELLLSREVAPEQVREALEMINSSAMRLSRLIDDLLSVSRIESGRLVIRKGPVELEEVLQEVAASFPRDPEIRIDVNGGVPPLLADRDMLFQIVTNLVSNAVKYSLPGSPVAVSANQKGESVEVSVEDRGIGMTEEEIAQLFQKFWRVDRPEVKNAGGTGLGLYITKNLVELQGGQLWVRSDYGSGSTFSFSLPLATHPDTKEAS